MSAFPCLDGASETRPLTTRLLLPPAESDLLTQLEADNLAYQVGLDLHVHTLDLHVHTLDLHVHTLDLHVHTLDLQQTVSQA